MRSTYRWLLALPLVATLAEGSDPPWLGAGEKLTYTLSYLHVVAGTLELEAKADTETVRLSMTATSTPGFSRIFAVNDRIETLLSRNPLSLIRQHASIAEGKRSYTEEILVDTVRGVAVRIRDSRPRGEVKVTPPVLDTLGSIYALRTFDLAPGRGFTLDVLSGKEVYPLVVIVTGRQTVKLATGKVETFVVEPRFRNGGLYKNESKLVLFVTQDRRHTPVRIVSRLPFGSLTATLQEASPNWQEVLHLKGEKQE